MAERRASDRVRVDFATRCRVPATPYPATVLDVSRTGCRVEVSAAHMAPGTTVHIDFDSAGSVSGVVAWSGAHTAGIKFHRYLDTAVAVKMGIEQPRAPEVPAIELAPADPTGLQHWIRAMFGFVKR
jgi:hypothetical protein